MPSRPTHEPAELVEVKPSSPYKTIAIELRDRIVDSTYAVGLPVPPVKELASEYEVSVSTIQRAVGLLEDWGLVSTARGKRTLVLQKPKPPNEHRTEDREPAPEPTVGAVVSQSIPVDLEVRHMGTAITKLRTQADPEDPVVLRRLLGDALRRHGADENTIGEYELIVRRAGGDAVLMTFVAAA